MLLQAVCDLKRFFQNVCAGQHGRVHDVGQFAWSKIYTQLRRREILPEPVMENEGIAVRPYLLGDSAYPSCLYLLKNFKPSITDPNFGEKRRFDECVNVGRVVIENAFGASRIDGEF